MTQSEKQLLLKDLCARLPYDPFIKIGENPNVFKLSQRVRWICSYGKVEEMFDDVKPYLRPMSSMTEEEFGFLQDHLPYDFIRIYSNKFDLINDNHLGNSISIDDMAFLLDYLNKRHFDYRGLIEKDLAIKAPRDMYHTKTE